MQDLLGGPPAARWAPGRIEGARRDGVCAVLGPTNTGKTHHAIERMLVLSLRRDWACLCACSRVRSIIASPNASARTMSRSSPARKRSSPARRPIGSRRSKRCRATSRRDFVAIDEIQLAADLDRGHIFTDRLLHWRGRQETLLIGAATMAPLVTELFPGAPIFYAPAAFKAFLRRRQENLEAAAAQRHRRLFGRRGLRDRGTDQAPARRRGRRARRAVAAHAQRADRALSERRRRLHRRDGRHRHGPQSRRRSCRLRLRSQIRRIAPSQADAGGIWTDRRQSGAPYERRLLWRDRPLPALRRGIDRGVGGPSLRSGEDAAMAQPAPSIFLRSTR